MWHLAHLTVSFLLLPDVPCTTMMGSIRESLRNTAVALHFDVPCLALLLRIHTPPRNSLQSKVTEHRRLAWGCRLCYKESRVRERSLEGGLLLVRPLSVVLRLVMPLLRPHGRLTELGYFPPPLRAEPLHNIRPMICLIFCQTSRIPQHCTIEAHGPPIFRHRLSYGERIIFSYFIC